MINNVPSGTRIFRLPGDDGLKHNKGTEVTLFDV